MIKKRNCTTMTELQACLQAAFNAINSYYYGGKLEKCVISITQGRKSGVLGTFYTSKEWVQNGTPRHEITIAANWLGKRTVAETIITLMHEMVHLYNYQNGIKDVSRGGHYHNKNFKKSAEEHGLIIECCPRIGWSATTASPDTLKWIAENINIREIRIYKTDSDSEEDKPKKKGSNMRKMVCPCCGAIARVTKDIQLICGECYTPDTDPMYMEQEN